jgi:hypothetical protein
VLEQRFLKGPQFDFDRAEECDVVSTENPSASPEFCGVVGRELSACPIACEDRFHLRDRIWIPCGRDANVPLETEHLCGMREVGGADVRGRVASLAVEDPCLSVKPRRRGVVRNLDLRAQPLEFVKGALFCAVRIGRCQDPQWLACLAVPPKRLYQRAHAAPADKRHDEVDSVSGRHFGAKLVSDRGFTRRVGEDSRVEQRREWPLDLLWSAVRQPFQQRY